MGCSDSFFRASIRQCLNVLRYLHQMPINEKADLLAAVDEALKERRRAGPEEQARDVLQIGRVLLEKVEGRCHVLVAEVLRHCLLEDLRASRLQRLVELVGIEGLCEDMEDSADELRPKGHTDVHAGAIHCVRDGNEDR